MDSGSTVKLDASSKAPAVSKAMDSMPSAKPSPVSTKAPVLAGKPPLAVVGAKPTVPMNR